ncbi:hypothetical protein ASD12_31870 [Mesorhizobium sp. Root102]|nr:hypothetical protein ASD12_31870 [Mesorhizobium sp. Root102]
MGFNTQSLMFPVKVDGKKARLLGRFAKQSDRLKLHRAGGGAQRRRLIRLSSAGWVPAFRVFVSGLSSV